MSFKDPNPYEIRAQKIMEREAAEAARLDHYVVVTVGPIRTFDDAMLEGQRLVGGATDRLHSASFNVDVRTKDGRDVPVILPKFVGFEVCDGCGSTMTDVELLARKDAGEKILSCCPERKMRAATREDLDGLRSEAKELQAQLKTAMIEGKTT